MTSLRKTPSWADESEFRLVGWPALGKGLGTELGRADGAWEVEDMTAAAAAVTVGAVVAVVVVAAAAVGAVDDNNNWGRRPGRAETLNEEAGGLCVSVDSSPAVSPTFRRWDSRVQTSSETTLSHWRLVESVLVDGRPWQRTSSARMATAAGQQKDEPEGSRGLDLSSAKRQGRTEPAKAKGSRYKRTRSTT
jgi:hypothetical protein